MIGLLTLLSSALLLMPTVSAVYTGFNYGAFWSEVANVKKENDFRKGFKLAQNLTTGTQFNSARLFTCKEQGTADTPTVAFESAIKTNTSLLLGFWITPGGKGESMEAYINQELSALEKGFKKHGNALSDLVIGLSVGSEDVYRFEDAKTSGLSAQNVSSAIAIVKEAMKTDKFAQYMKDKPIGHVDTAKHVVVEGADFYGMTAYPYWSNDPVAKAKESFFVSLDNVKQRAGNTPVWIAEMGWPYDGPQRGEALAGKDSLQEFWKTVGCEIIGKYNTFWYELIMDAEQGQPDFGILNPDTQKPRIDLTCPGLSPPVETTIASSSTAADPTIASTVLSSMPVPAASLTPASNMTSAISTRTVRVTTTIAVIVQPDITLKRSWFGSFTNSSAPAGCPASKTTPAPAAAPSLSSEFPWCITVVDVDWNGQYVPVAGNPAGQNGDCSSPPTYTGLPYGASTGEASPPAILPAAVPSSPDVVSSVTPLTSTPQASSAVPVASNPADLVPSIPVAPVASSPAASVASSSPAPSIPASYPAAQPSGTPSHPYCKRKASTLGGAATPSEQVKSTLTTQASSTTLPDFTLVTDTAVAKKDRRSRAGRVKRWALWW